MKVGATRIRRCSIKQIAKQWDGVAAERDDQIRSGRDVSYNHVLVPALLDLARACNWARVVDVGCGSGTLTEILAARSEAVWGVDISQASIELAERSPSRRDNSTYVNETVQEFASRYHGPRFTLAVANMMLQDAPDLDGTLSGIASLLGRNATLVCTITHPCFWPDYWGYGQAEWFEYEQEVAIEARFRISSARRAVGITTHFHRPLERYLHCLVASGFRVDSLQEPFPSAAVQSLYPKRWKYPRFLGFRCIRSHV